MGAEVDLSRNPERLVELLPDGWAGRGALFRGLAEALRRLVDEGDLTPGARLPSERGLAAALALSRSTVVAAYDELRADGTLASRQGSGTLVARRSGGGRRRTGHGHRQGQAESVLARLTQGPGRVISLAYAADAGAPELAEALREVTAYDLPICCPTPATTRADCSCCASGSPSTSASWGCPPRPIRWW